jgi:hypothetical protein
MLICTKKPIYGTTYHTKSWLFWGFDSCIFLPWTLHKSRVLHGKENAKELLCQVKLVEATNVTASSYNGFHETML